MKPTPHPDRAILILGEREPSHAALADAERYAEVYVLARAVHNRDSHYLIDDGRAEADARGRLQHVAAHLRARGCRTRGLVGDADAQAARRDAMALFPQPSVLLEVA
jgi:hypothetical protein